MVSKGKANSHAIGILYIILAALGFSLMSLFVRMSGDIPTMQKTFFRNLVASGVAVYLLARTPEKFRIRKECIPTLFLRSIFGTAGLIANFWAIDHMVIADSNILNKMSPFFAIIMSIFILKEVPKKFEWLTVVLAFVGAVFVVKPTSGVASLPALVGLFGGFAAGTAYTFVRKLGKMGERGPVIVLFFSAFSTVVAIPFMIGHYQPMAAWQLGCLLLAGASAALGQISITAAYTHAPAKEISVFDYTQVVFAALWGFLFFGEVPDYISVIGYVIIIGTGIVKWYYTLRTDETPAES